MNNLLIGIIGVLLAVVAFSILTESCPRGREIITAWEELAKETHLPPVGRGPVPRHALGPKGPEEASIAKKMLIAREIILLILLILQILIQTTSGFAGDRPPHYVT